MSSTLLLRRSLLLSARPQASGLRYASTEGAAAFKKGPSTVETDPQGSNNRGKTTQKILPIVAVALAVGAFTWRFTSADKGKITEMGNTNRSKTQSKSAHEAIVNPDVPTPGQK